jgi:hypothetical protein
MCVCIAQGGFQGTADMLDSGKSTESTVFGLV